MNHLYQKTFDHVYMSEDRVRSLRAVLASHCSDPETEVITMNKQKILRRPATFLVAVLLIAALSVTALACGKYVTYQIRSGNDGAQTPPENSITFDLTEQGSDVTFHSYEYTEENGEVQVFLDDDDWGNLD